MKLTISKMKLQNFMGIRQLEIVCDGNMVIRGDNGTGKTTIKSAFSWLLFNKNTFGKTDFQVKPLDKDGNIIHHLETAVEVEFDIDGVTKSFKKTLTEKWTRKRGAAVETYGGNESGYFIDGIPTTKTEYNKVIAAIIDEGTFKTITDPLYFNEQMDWKKRREMLIDICGDISDTDVINADPELAPLLEVIKTGRTVEQHKTVVKAAMGNINSELGLIPAKINEAELAKPNVAEITVDAAEKYAVEEHLRELQEAKYAIVNGAELTNLKAEKNRLNTLLKPQTCNLSDTPEYKRYSTIKNELLPKVSMVIQNHKISLQHLAYESTMKRNKERRAELSVEWDKVSERLFTDEKCPTCGRELPADELEKKRREFNIKRVKDLDKIEAELLSIKESEAQLEQEHKRIAGQIEAEEANKINLALESNGLETTLDKMKREALAEIEAHNADIRAQIAEVDKQIAGYGESVKARTETIDLQINGVQAHIAEINKGLAALELADRQDKRIAELKAEQVKLSTEYMNNERELYLCEQFTKRKINMLNDKINSRFKLARFKLFDIQVNGGIAETCETTYNGVPYSDLNNAMRINIGIDVINALCERFDTYAPIFIDNAESVNKILESHSQQIRLYVSDNKTLQIERI